jgi:hypothetical protein
VQVAHQAVEPGEIFSHSLHARHAGERAVVSGLDKSEPHHRYLQESKLTKANQLNKKQPYEIF